MKQELDNAQKVERYTLKQKLAAQLIEKEKELESVTREMHNTKGLAAFRKIAEKRASLTVDISTLNRKLTNICNNKPLLGYDEGMGSYFATRNIGMA